MTTRKCSICKIEKDIGFFYVNAISGKTHTSCKKCSNKRKYEKIKQDPIRYTKMIAWKKMRRELKIEEMRQEINRIKTEKGCFICNYNTFPSALLFHHLDPNQKENDISSIMHKGNKEKYYKELSKCIILCFNCHIALHSGRVSLPEKEKEPVQVNAQAPGGVLMPTNMRTFRRKTLADLQQVNDLDGAKDR